MLKYMMFITMSVLGAAPMAVAGMQINTRTVRPGFHPEIRRSVRFAVFVTVCGLWLAASGSHNGSAQAAVTVYACSLLSDTEVHALAPGLSAGHKGKVIVANTSTCEWDDAHHLPALTLLVSPVDPSGVKKGLEEGFANMGYDVRDVAGLGDEAAVAVQRADPVHGIEAAVAELALRVGKREIVLSPIRLNISTTTGADFDRLKTAAVHAAARLHARE